MKFLGTLDTAQDYKIETMIITKGESCFDSAHIKLVAEVEELGESCKLLADKVVFL